MANTKNNTDKKPKEKKQPQGKPLAGRGANGYYYPGPPVEKKKIKPDAE